MNPLHALPISAKPFEKKASVFDKRPMMSNAGLNAGGIGRKASRYLHRNNGVIGASCLSIIGMIEPGRTVRLYRQIH